MAMHLPCPSFMKARDAGLAWLMVLLAALSIATSVSELPALHFVFKPLPLLAAIVAVAARAYFTGARARFDLYLLAALVASLAGDVFLMLPGNYFIPGLASFLVAHLFYIALFRQGVPWFPSRRALGLTLGLGGAMYAWVWAGLIDPALKVAVAAYVSVIALMVAQAIGRALVLRDGAARAVGLGACVFMLSDSLIAINRFVQPLPLVSVWVLATYYTAQILIVRYVRPVVPVVPAVPTTLA